MKKTLIIIFITALGLLNPFYAKSQTKEQTVNWLKAKSGSLKYAINYLIELDYDGAVKMSYPQSSSISDIIKVDFSKVNAVSYVKQQAANGYPDAYMISLGGTFAKFYYSDSKEYTNVSSISLSYMGVDENDAKRIVKAYEHLATLCGGKVVNDDLFKN